MLRAGLFLGLLGLAVATGLIIWSGYDQVVSALAVAGFSGILITSFAHILNMVSCIIGWRALLPGRQKQASHLFFLYLLWIRAAINALMPVARVGGEVVAVRLMMRHGVRKGPAIACMVVETTTSVIAAFLFTLLGIALFAMRVPDDNLIGKLVLGMLASVPLIAGLVFVQKVGAFGLLTKLFNLFFRDTWKKFAGNTDKLDHAVRAMYRRKGRTLYCGVWQFIAWVAGAVEIWLALHFLGHTVTFTEALMVEALIQAVTTAAFLVPGALGVQEAGFLLFGHWLGLPPDIAAALAVIRRCRDLILYVPALIVWQVQEGRWLLGKRKT